MPSASSSPYVVSSLGTASAVRPTTGPVRKVGLNAGDFLTRIGTPERPGPTASVITSPSGEFWLALQTDGNFVIWRSKTDGTREQFPGRPIWQPNQMNKGAVKLLMQQDGNLVLLNAANGAVWSSGTAGNPYARLRMQDDGNLVIYNQRDVPVWQTYTSGGTYHPPEKKSWFSKAIGSATKPLSNLGKAVASVGEGIVKTGFKVVTLPLNTVKLVDDIAHGKNVKDAVVDKFKADLAVAHDVAPYVQTVVSVVPGIGTGVAAGLAGACALAEGKRIDDVLIAAARGAVPGGPLGQAAFDVATQAVQGKNITASALQALQNQVPEAARPAFAVGVALAQGKNLQDAVAKGASLIPGIPSPVSKAVLAASKMGSAASMQDAILGAARDSLPGGEAAKTGFDVANGILLTGHGIDEKTLLAARNQLLNADAIKAFDTAVAIQIGRTSGIAAPANIPVAARAAFYAAKGLRGAPLPVAQNTIKNVATTPAAKQALTIGVKAAGLEKTAEGAQKALVSLRAQMRLAHQGHKPTLQTIANIVQRTKTGDKEATRSLQMLAVAERANRELDHRPPGAGPIAIGGFATVAWQVAKQALLVPWDLVSHVHKKGAHIRNGV